MSLNRIRARIRYTKSSGLGVWSRDQMNVRYEQAVIIKDGFNNQEDPQNSVVDDPNDPENYEIFTCDLPLQYETAANDAFATLTDASVFGQAHTSQEGWEPPNVPSLWDTIS